MAKYDALRDHLSRSGGSVDMNFGNLANLVGGLPRSAYEHGAWWANNLDHVQAAAWIAASYRVESFSLSSRRVRFIRL